MFHHVIIIIDSDRVSLAYAEQCRNDISHNKNISQITPTMSELESSRYAAIYIVFIRSARNSSLRITYTLAYRLYNYAYW